MEAANNKYQDEAFDLGSFINRLKNYWVLFLISVIIMLILAFVYMKISSPRYAVNASVLIKNVTTSKSAKMETLGDLGLVSDDKNLENEVGLIMSHSIVTQTIKANALQVSYFTKYPFKSVERYTNKKFNVLIDTTKSQIVGMPLYINKISGQKYILSAEGTDPDIYDYSKQKVYRKKVGKISIRDTLEFGKTFNSKNLSFTVYDLDTVPADEDYKSYFVINDLNKLAEDYRSKIKVTPINKNASILELSIETPTIEKEIDFLNMLLTIYIRNSLLEKNQKHINTVNFIDKQLIGVSDSLHLAENKLQSFRTNNQTLDLNYEAKNIYDNLKELESKQAQEIVRSKYYNYLSEYVRKNQNANQIVAPSVVGITDVTLSNLINELAELNSQKAALGYSAKEKNPNYQILILKIENLRNSLVENVNNLKMSSKFSIDELNKNIKSQEELLKKIPQTEQGLINVQRKYALNDNIYTFLLEKRAESSLAKESNIADAKVVDHAKLVGSEPVFPNKKLLFAVAIFLGLLIPLAYIILKDLFSNKIVYSTDIIENSQIPVIGIIPHIQKKQKLNTQAFLNDSFRYVMLNLKDVQEGNNKVIAVSSYTDGEGKSFFARHFASTLATDGKKVLIVDFNLGKLSKIATAPGQDTDNNLQDYLDYKVGKDEIIKSAGMENMYYVSSGNSNVSIHADRIGHFINEVRYMFDYVVLITPPVFLSINYLPLSKFVDFTIYIIKQNFTKKTWLAKANELYKKAHSENFYIVVNSIKSKNVADWENYGFIPAESRKKTLGLF